MSFPGRWGGQDETRLVNKADREPLAAGGGPTCKPNPAAHGR
jgi:hypothetical protein